MKSTAQSNYGRLVVLLTVISCTPLAAQPVRTPLPETPALAGGYRLEIRLLVRGSAAARVKDREWAMLFQQAGYRATIASDNGGEAIGIRSRKAGRRSVVEVVGVIERGVLRLGTERFRLGEVQPLKDFLGRLEQHGADGPVRERSTWGLSVPQYTEVLKLLAVRIDEELPLSSPVDVVQAASVPRELRVTWSPAARKLARSGPVGQGTLQLTRLSLGTGLAAGLAQFGLGFRVMEHPRGGFLLEVDVGDESSNLWPVGWKNKRPPMQVVPTLYQPVAVDLQDEVVADVIDLVADRVEIPWVHCRHQLKSKGIDLDMIRYSTLPAKTMPSRLLRSIANENRMGIEPRTDEAGQMFLWCTTSAEQAAWKKRFAHVIPGKSDKPSKRP